MKHHRPFLSLVLLFLSSSSFRGASGHGRLMDPPSRNAMWRFGFSNPVNYNDNEVWCGGFGVQYDKNGGKCGVCGDSWDEEPPREHEAGGRYGNGVIGKWYVEGQRITVEVDLTTNHWGHFELKLCPVNDKTKIATQECMDQHPLYLADDPSSYKYRIPEDVGKSAVLKYDVLLPKGLTCTQCVVQWTYITGNTWAECSDGSGGAVGCGDQENFRNCADIKIYSNVAGRPPIAANVGYPKPYVYMRDPTYPFGKRPYVIRSQVCVTTELYSNIPEMDKWCQENCLKYPPNCDPTKCTCLDECEGIGRLAGIDGTDIWCQRQCLRYPSTCPKEDCRCFSRREEEAGDGVQVVAG